MKQKRLCGIGLAAAVACQVILPQLPVTDAAAAGMQTCSLAAFSDAVLSVTESDADREFYDTILYDAEAGTLSADGGTPDTVCGDLAVQDGELMLRTDGDAGENLESFAEMASEWGYETDEQSGILTITNEFQTARLIVKAKGKIDLRGAESAAEGYRDLHILQYADSAAAYRAYQAYCSDPAVEYVQPSHRILLDAQEISRAETDADAASDDAPAQKQYNSWGVPLIGSEDFIAEYLDQEALPEVIVAVLDTGLNRVPKLFEGRILGDGINFSDSGDDSSADDLYHGTHVTGTICEMTPDNVKILPVKVFDENGSASDEQIYLGLMYAMEQGADIVNMSFGGLGVSPLEIEAMSIADANGMICCAASGNNGDDAGYYYPGSIASCITVGAVSQDMERANFSNYGSSLDVVAPGVGIMSYVLGEAEEKENQNGTSMATPHVSACCALLRSYDKDMTPARAEALLRLNATDLGPAGFDRDFGWGFINMSDFRWDDGICPAPVFSVRSGNYGKAQTVALSVNLDDAKIYYTTDGTVPTPENGTLYQKPVTVSETTQLLAVAVREGWIGSAVSEVVYSINGEDVRAAYTVQDGVLISYRGIREKLIVPETIDGQKITAIAPHAFENNHFTTQLQFHSSVKSIGESAFANCSVLKRIYAPGVNEIGAEAFAGSAALREVTLGDKISSVGEAAFRGCSALTEITLHGLTAVPAELFADCVMLEKTDLPDVAEIGSEAFANCQSLTALLIRWQHITAIGDRAFSDCAAWAGDVRLPVLETLGEGVFSGDSSLHCVMLPERITTLPAHTFEKCSAIRQLSLPGVTELGEASLAMQTGKMVIPTALDYSKITSVGEGALGGFLIGNGYDTVTFSALETVGSRAFSGAYAGALAFPKLTAVPESAFANARIDCAILEQVKTIAAGSLTGVHAVRLTEALQSAEAGAFANETWIVAESELPALAGTEGLQFCNEPLVMRLNAENMILWQHDSAAIRVLACGDTLKYQWYTVSGETQTAISGADQPEFCPDTSLTGSTVYRCITTDQQGKQEQISVTVNVIAGDAPEVLAPETLRESEDGSEWLAQIRVPESGEYRILSSGNAAAGGVLCDAAGQPVAEFESLLTGGEVLQASLNADETYYLRTEALWKGGYALHLSGAAEPDTDVSECALKVTVQTTAVYGSGYEPEVIVRKPDGTVLKRDTDYFLRFTKQNQRIRISVYGIGQCFGYAETTVTVYEKIPEDTPVPVQISHSRDEAVYVFIPKTTGVYNFYAGIVSGYAEEYQAYNRTGRYAGGSKYVNISTRCWVADTPTHNNKIYAYSDFSSVTKEYFNAQVTLNAGQTYYFVCGGSSGAQYSLIVTQENHDIRSAEVTGSFFGSYSEDLSFRPRIRVRLGETELTEGVDYQRIDSRNDVPGKATVTVVGMGIYYGRIAQQYEILYSEPEQNGELTPLDTPVEVTCQNQRVTTIWFRVETGKTANETVRYRVLNERLSGGKMQYNLYRYDELFDSCALMLPMNGEVNDYLLTNGTYVVAVSREFPEMASKANISVLIPHSVTDAVLTVTNQPYTGSVVPLPVQVHAEDGTELELDRDFRINYKESNIMFGTVPFSLYATERTFGYQEGEFEIYVDLPEDAPELEVGEHSVSVTKEDRLAVYRVTPETDTEYVLCTSDAPDIVLRVFTPEAEMLEQDHGAGTKSVTFTIPAGETRYLMVKFNGTAREGVINFRLETTLRMLSACEIQAERQIWTGEQIAPDVTFTDGDYVLVEGTDYRLRYTADDVNIGMATANYVGMGKYFGTCDVEYEIVPENLFEADFFDPVPLALGTVYPIDKNRHQYMVLSYTSGIETTLHAAFFEAMCQLSVQCYDGEGNLLDSAFFKPSAAVDLPVKAGETVYFLVSATNISSRNQNFNVMLSDGGKDTMHSVRDEGGIGYRISESGDYAEAFEITPGSHERLTLLPEIEGVPVSFVPEALFSRLDSETVVIGYAGCAAAEYADRYGFIYQQAADPEQAPVKGDLNGDGRCSAADLAVCNAMLGEEKRLDVSLFPFDAADLNGDEIFDLLDLRVLRKLTGQ